MGCDIHVFAEIRNGKKWEKVGDIFNDPYFDPKYKISEFNKPKTDAPYKGRNYDLFAVLADVRNGYGFSGCDTGGGFNPIDKPKGIPDDASKEIKKESQSWGSDGHSHSYLTLNELLAYDWKGQKTKHRGWVSAKEFQEFKKNGRPSSWCASVEGRMVTHISVHEMERRISESDFMSLDKYYCLIEWEVSYYEDMQYFVDTTIPELKKLGNPSEVRIVFWFDN